METLTPVTPETLEAFEQSLPPMAQPVANYVMSVQTGNLVYTSGVLPVQEGQVLYKGPIGNILAPVEYGQEAARLCCLNLLSVLKNHLGSLSRVERIVKLNGFVNSSPQFTDHPKVVNAASDLLVAVFGERGKHARAAVGVASLPLGASVELEMIVQVSS